MTTSTRQGDILWEPPEAVRAGAVLTHYLNWIRGRYGIECSEYEALWRWSVTEIEAFWGSVWEYFDVQSTEPYEMVLPERVMPGANWFSGARLNFTANVFRQRPVERPALLFAGETVPLQTVTWGALERDVAAAAAGLRALGVGPGDRVAAYLPNIPPAVVALLACAAIGAIWSSCPPEFGPAAVQERFGQIEPKVLLAVQSYRYGGKEFDRSAVVDALASLPGLETVVLVPTGDKQHTMSNGDAILWEDLLRRGAGAALHCEPLPPDHPLWILYSSGTSGLPKAIVHGHAGIIVEHLKAHALQMDVQASDRLFTYTTTGWMMWNLQVGALLLGASIVLYDGSPAYPDLDVIWRLAEESQATQLSTSAAYLSACRKAAMQPGQNHALRLRSLKSTGSPLEPESYAWVYDAIAADIWLASSSGGTDVCSAFVGGSPLLPVRAGEIQCRCLGALVEAVDEDGRPVADTPGEMVVRQPMPSMPLYLWNDPGGTRYHDTYFRYLPGVWRHGDVIRITPHGGCIIYGRSDATINRHGVRMGSGELYRVVEALPEVRDSLVVDLEGLGQRPLLVLFVVPATGSELDGALDSKIRDSIRQAISPRHVPDRIIAVPAIPRTLNGKKLEIPVRRILLGANPQDVAVEGGGAEATTLAAFVSLGKQLRSSPAGEL